MRLLSADYTGENDASLPKESAQVGQLTCPPCSAGQEEAWFRDSEWLTWTGLRLQHQEVRWLRNGAWGSKAFLLARLQAHVRLGVNVGHILGHGG